MQKIILFYKFVPIADPKMAMLWQRELCLRLNLKGRIIVSEHGINGTLGGELDDLVQYKRENNASGIFRGIDYKWTAGSADHFPRLSVKVRPELVSFGMPEDVAVSVRGVEGGGRHLTPEEVNALVAERGDDVMFFDGRNAYEAEIGKFANAFIPKVETSHDFLSALDDPELQQHKDRPIITYCTGGIRCEILSAVMKEKGFSEVYQIKGGVVRYVEQFGESALWKGSLYTFDGRMVVDFGEETSSLGHCDTCGAEEKIFRNCGDLMCATRFLRCDACMDAEPMCDEHAKVSA